MRWNGYDYTLLSGEIGMAFRFDPKNLVYQGPYVAPKLPRLLFE